MDLRPKDVRIDVDVIQALGIEGARPAYDAVDFVVFVEKELSQIRSVLAGDAGDQSAFHVEAWIVLGGQ